MKDNCVTNYLAFQVLLIIFYIEIIHLAKKTHTILVQETNNWVVSFVSFKKRPEKQQLDQ